MPEPRSLRLLVVEDEGILVLMLEDMLEEIGHRVSYTAASVEDALAIIAAHGADLDGCVLDANLGGVFATPIAHELRRAAIPFVIVSGYEGRELIRLDLTAPAISKPYSMTDLRSALLRL